MSNIIAWYQDPQNPGYSYTTNNFTSYSSSSVPDSGCNNIIWTGTRWFNTFWRVSTDGVTWGSQTLSAGTYSTYGYAIAMVGGNLHIVTGGWKYFISTDEGSTWTQKTTISGVNSNTGSYPVKIISDTQGTVIIVHGCGNKFAISTDGATTWTLRTIPGTIPNLPGWGISLFYLNGLIYEQIDGGNQVMYYSSDQGATWNATTDGNGNTNPSNRAGLASWGTSSFAAASETSAVMAATIGLGYVARYTTDGTHWFNATSGWGAKAGTMWSVVWSGTLFLAQVQNDAGGGNNLVDFYSSPTGATWTLIKTSVPGAGNLRVNYFINPFSTQVATLRNTQTTAATNVSTTQATAASQITTQKAAVLTLTTGSTTQSAMNSAAASYVSAQAAKKAAFTNLASNLQSSKSALSSILTLCGQTGGA